MKRLTKAPKKKLIFILLAALTGMAASQLTFAAGSTSGNNNNNTGTPQNSIVAAINGLGNKIEALTIAGVKMVNNLMYQFDQNLPGIVQANTATSIASQQTKAQADAATQKNINQSLQEFAYAVTPPEQGTAAYTQYQDYLNQNSPVTLSNNIKASDTLYTRAVNKPFKAQQLNTVKPTPEQLHNNYFNFETLFSPLAYSSNQLEASNRFVQYITQDYKPLTEGINFSQLQNQSPEVLHKFMNSAGYRNYQLSTRAMLASRSMVLSNFYWLISQRTTVPGLGAKAGLKDSAGNLIKNASPLQVEKYIATHRIRSAKWYQEMAAASPATVQRETLYVLAEIEAQNFRAHMDRERILAALTGMELQSAQVNQLMSKIKAEKLNAAIAVATGHPPPQNSNNAYSQETKKYAKKYQQDQKGKKSAAKANKAANAYKKYSQ